MRGNSRKVIKDAGNFRFVKITGKFTQYAIQYKYTRTNHNYHHVKDQLSEYLNTRTGHYGDWCEFYISNKKQCNKHFTYCVLKWA